MDFNLTNEQQAIQKTMRELGRQRLNADVFKCDQEMIFPFEKWRLCAQAGICGLPISEQYGGQEQNMLSTALAIEALAEGCMDEGLVFSICAHLCTCIIPIFTFGTKLQKQTYLPGLINGSWIGGNGMTEADAGSDTGAIQTEVVKQNEQFVLNGAKLFVTNAPHAAVMIVYAKHAGGMPPADITAFIINMDCSGIKSGQTFEKMGLRSSAMGELLMHNCRITKDHLLGRERLGMQVFHHSMLWERIIMSAYHVGAIKQQYQKVLEYSGSRKQFGKPLKRIPQVADKLIEMKVRLKNAELMLYYVAAKYDNQKATLADAAMLKLSTSEAKIKNSLDAVQLYGAYGYMKENLIEKQLRDSVAATIYSGTSEIQKKIMAEAL